MQIRNGFMKIKWLLMLESVILCVLEKIQELKLLFSKVLVTKNSKERKILGVTIDNKLTFKSDIKNLGEKTSQKIGALSRFSNHLNDYQKRLDLNYIVKSKFSYCPLVWMICSRTSNNMISKVHERVLSVILNEH